MVVRLAVSESQMAEDLCLEAYDLESTRDGRTLFTQLTFTLRAKQMLLLEGANGSGKTTLLRILCGIRLPDVGEVRWCGKDIQNLRAEYYGHIAHVGHKDGVKQELTPYENLRVAQAMMGSFHLQETIDTVLDRFGLSGYEDSLTRNLSAGQQRRLSLARLLVINAPLWILDEPFTSLDRFGIEIAQNVMQSHVDGGGMIILATHHKVDLDESNLQRINLSKCAAGRY